MTNELDDIKKIRLKKVFVLMAGGKKLKEALKEVEMSYTDYRHTLADYPSLTDDFIQEQQQTIFDLFVQVIDARKDLIQAMLARVDSCDTLPSREVIALEKRLTEIQHEIEEGFAEMAGPGEDERQTHTASEEYIKSLDLQGPHLVRAVSRIAGEQLPRPFPTEDDLAGKPVQGAN